MIKLNSNILKTRFVVFAISLIVNLVSFVLIFKHFYETKSEATYNHSINVVDDYSDEDNSSNNLYLNAVKLIKQRKHDESVKLLKQSIISDPQHAQSYYLLGRVYEDNILSGHEGKLLTEMKNYYIKYLDLKPEGARSSYVKLRLAQYYIRSSLNTNNKQDIDYAFNLLKGADESNPDVKMAMGAIFLSKKQFEAAAKEFEKAINVEPNELPTRYNSLGLAYIRLKKFAEAKKVLEIAVSIEPDNAYAYNNLGYVYIKLGMFIKASEAFKKAVSIDPTYKAAVNNLEWVSTDKEIRSKILKETENNNKLESLK